MQPWEIGDIRQGERDGIYELIVEIGETHLGLIRDYDLEHLKQKQWEILNPKFSELSESVDEDGLG